jgi:predicted MFS family arabinose efflux permease
MVTCWNIGIGGGAIIGGVLLGGIGPASVMWAALGLLILALVVTLTASQNGFPGLTRRRDRATLA